MGMNFLDTFLALPVVARLRRNHGLEHATLHILQERLPRRTLAGHSDVGGFWLLGEVETESVREAVGEALRRMQAGEQHLAIHPNCGTNFVTAGVLAGLASFIALLGSGPRIRDRLERLPFAATLATLALILAQPLGYGLQQNVTTDGEVGDMEVVQIIPNRTGRVVSHRILTRS